MTRLIQVLGAVAEAVGASADELNRLDAQAGDGDLGVTMRTAASLVLGLLPTLDGHSTAEALKACGLALARGAPSTAGTLVASGFLRAATEAKTRGQERPAVTVAALLRAASQGISERGGAEVGSKTMLDALVPAADAAEHSARNDATVQEVLAAAAAAAEVGARATATMRAVHGRAGWLAERSAGHEDAGARLIANALGAAADAAAVPGAGSSVVSPLGDPLKPSG